MTNYINIENLAEGSKYRKLADMVDKRKADPSNPKDVGDANDNRLSEREIARIEKLLAEEFRQKPQKDIFGNNIPISKRVSDAIQEMFDLSGANYKQFQWDIAKKSVKNFFGRILS